MRLKVLATLAIAVLTVQCSHKVNLALQPEYDESVLKESELSSVPAMSFRKGSFADKRADPSKLGSFKQGMHTYNLYAERPIEDALFEGLQRLVGNAGHSWTDQDSADVQVDLQLLNVNAARNAGFVQVGAVSGVQIKLDVIDGRTGRLLHSDVYNGADGRSRTLIGTMGMVKESLDASLIDCINNVGKDAKLAAVLKTRTTADN